MSCAIIRPSTGLGKSEDVVDGYPRVTTVAGWLRRLRVAGRVVKSGHGRL